MESHVHPIPGYVAGRGRVMLPTELNGEETEFIVGGRSANPKVLAKKLQKAVIKQDHPSFINRHNRFRIHATRRDYETMHKPAWLMGMVLAITATIRGYAESEDGQMISGLTPYPLTDMLEGTWSRLSSYVGSLLCVGGVIEAGTGIGRTSHLVFGHPLADTTHNRLTLIDWLSIIDLAYHRRLSPRLTVCYPDGRQFDLPDPHGVDDAARSTQTFIMDDAGNYTFAGSYTSHPAFEERLREAYTEINRMMGMFVFAQYNIRIKDVISRFKSTGAPPPELFARFLCERRRVEKSDAIAQGGLAHQVMADIKAKPLNRTLFSPLTQ